MAIQKRKRPKRQQQGRDKHGNLIPGYGKPKLPGGGYLSPTGKVNLGRSKDIKTLAVNIMKKQRKKSS